MIFPAAPEDMILLLRLKRLGLRNLIGEPITESTFVGEGFIGVVVVMEVEVKVEVAEAIGVAVGVAETVGAVSNRKTEVCGELKVTGLNFFTCVEDEEEEAAKNGETSFLEQASSKLDADFLLASVMMVSAEQEIIGSRLEETRSDLLDLGERLEEGGFEMSEVLVVALLVAEEEAEMCRASASWV